MKRKNILVFLAWILALFVLVSCQSKGSKNNDKPIVYASFFPIYDLTKTVAGDAVDVRCFMPTSATVHSWEPTPKKLGSCQRLTSF